MEFLNVKYMARQKPIVFNDFFFGGLADSKYAGPPNSVADILGIDFHREPGLMHVNQKLSALSAGDSIDDLCVAMVPCSDGNVYAFGYNNGKIWKIEANGTVTYLATAAPAAGGVGILDAKEFRGKIYYAMEERLGQWTIGDAWSSRNDNFGAFANGASEHPMVVTDNLFIGDGQQMAEVDYLHAFTDEVWQYPIESRYTIRCLEWFDDIVWVGTYVNDGVADVKLFMWNTWSPIPDGQDPIPEVGINAFIKSDNFMFAQCGVYGRFYFLNGYKLEALKTLPGNFTETNKARMYPNASAYFRNRPHFAVSNISGNPTDQVVYSFGNNRAGYDRVWNKEYPVSLRSSGEYVMSNLTIGSLCVQGDYLYVAWQTGSTYEIDRIDYTAKLEYAYFESRVIAVDRNLRTDFNESFAAYSLLPDDTSVVLKYKETQADSFAVVSTIVDTDNLLVKAVSNLGAGVSSQIRCELHSNGNDAPVLEGVTIFPA